MASALSRVADATGVAVQLAALVGREPLTDGVLHTVAVGDGGAALPVVMRIVAATPKSGHDFFLLNVARARSQAIITTGRILREEPDLDFSLDSTRVGAGSLGRALALYRLSQVGAEPPVVLVLTSGRDPAILGHPGLEGAVQPLVYTTTEGGRRLASEATARGIEVAATESPDVRGAIGELRRRGLGRISVEAGPSTALDLYSPPVLIDELLLSQFEGGPVPEAVRGRPFLDRERLTASFVLVAECAVDEPSGRWRFARYRRAAGSVGTAC